MNGVLYLSNGEIEEPFKAYYDAASGRSRIDYYGGTVSTFQLSHEGEYGKMYRIVPVTTFEESNKRTCYQADAGSQGEDEDGKNNCENDENDKNDENDNSTDQDQENSDNEEGSGNENELKVTDQTTVTDENEVTDQNIATEAYEDFVDNEIRARKVGTDNDDVKKDDKNRIKPQTVLPDCVNFKYYGMEEKIKLIFKIALQCLLFYSNKTILQALKNCSDGNVTDSY